MLFVVTLRSMALVFFYPVNPTSLYTINSHQALLSFANPCLLHIIMLSLNSLLRVILDLFLFSCGFQRQNTGMVTHNEPRAVLTVKYSNI